MPETVSNFLDRKYGADNWQTWAPEYFLSVVAHELRPPLALIKGYTAILSNENTKESHSTAIENISNSIQIIEELREGIIEYGRKQHPDV